MNRIATLKLETKSREKPTPSSALDLASLWDAYRISRAESLRNRLLLHYLPLSRAIAYHMHSRMPASVELDDLAQAASLGLRSAIASFDPARGVSFEKFCGPRVRGSVLDHLRSLDWAPRMLRSRVHHMQKMVRQMEMSTGTPPTDEQLSAALGMPMDDVHTLRNERRQLPLRIRATAQGEDQQHAINLELVPDGHGHSPVHEAQRADLKEFLLRGLSPTDRQVIIQYYYDNMSLLEIGVTLGLCESRVSQIHKSVLARLRDRMDRIGGNTLDN